MLPLTGVIGKTQAMTNDRQLAQNMLSGDELAFEEFFNGYFPRLFRFAVARLRDEAAAEEVVQATLCRAIAKLATYRGEAALFSWLCTICRHEIGAYVKKHRREVAELPEDQFATGAALDSLAAALTGNPEELASQRETARLVQVVLDYLPPHYGDALEWKYIQGMSVREIAERLELGLKATESLLVRARLAFRDGFSDLMESTKGFES